MLLGLNFQHSARPILFERDVPKGVPARVKLQDGSSVVWRKASDPTSYGILPDRCTHRLARLSAGKVVQDCIECPYHGWQFNASGKCVSIPQKVSQRTNSVLPNAVHHTDVLSVQPWDGVLWTSTAGFDVQPNPIQKSYTNNASYIVTDKGFEAPYSYMLQIENLLDPAHINFVHDGFQGDRANAGEIKVTHLEISDNALSGLFEHPGQRIPNVKITFHMPYVVEVSIYDAKGENVVRKNIIYVTPIDSKSCRVLFRDVVIKKYIAPNEPFSSMLVDFISGSQTYQEVSARIVDDILQQDIDVLIGQQENITAEYADTKYVLPTESDRLIVEFRRWIKRVQSKA